MKYPITPFTGGTSAMGLVVSIMVLPLILPAIPEITFSATTPLTARITISPNAATSSKLPVSIPVSFFICSLFVWFQDSLLSN